MRKQPIRAPMFRCSKLAILLRLFALPATRFTDLPGAGP